MSDTNDAASRSEEATPRRLEDARRRGEVAKSFEVPQWASLAAAATVLMAYGPALGRGLVDSLTPFLRAPDAFGLENGGGVVVARQAMLAAWPTLAAVLGAAGVGGAAGNLVQHGFLFAPTRLAPDLGRISPGQGLRRLFGVDGLIQFGRSALKAVILGAIAYFTVRPHVSEVIEAASLDPLSALAVAMRILKGLFIATLAALGAIAIMDWVIQRQRFLQRMRMTKEEVKEDFRQAEGDPHVRARLRQIRVERSRRRMIQNVPKATVVVMNPTHYAVALRYVQGETAAPVCVAKGLDLLALRIREEAERHAVAVVEDPPLARALYAAVEVDQSIPREHYEAVAKVIGFVLQTAQRRRRALG